MKKIKKTLKDLVDTAKYKRKYNKCAIKYMEVLENKVDYLEKIEHLQDQLLAALPEIAKLRKELKEEKKKNEKN